MPVLHYSHKDVTVDSYGVHLHVECVLHRGCFWDRGIFTEVTFWHKRGVAVESIMTIAQYFDRTLQGNAYRTEPFELGFTVDVKPYRLFVIPIKGMDQIASSIGLMLLNNESFIKNMMGIITVRDETNGSKTLVLKCRLHSVFAGSVTPPPPTLIRYDDKP